MKIKTDLHGEIEMPEILVKEFTEAWQECENKEGYKSFEDFVDDIETETIYDCLHESNGKMVDKELAIFLQYYHAGIIPSQGGYPTSEEFTFEENGTQYTILAFV
ncbi:unnamed protein product [marine sediment metagenome]|uniref:Uncharacterized protein n=1 Tax=marine sediment metagenome TaxID=412755 RepID=X1EZ44_9ZZZZ